MTFYEELGQIDAAKLDASFEKVVSEGQSGDMLMPPPGNYEPLIHTWMLAEKYFDAKAEEVRRKAAEDLARGAPIDDIKLARAIGRIEGMGAGVLYAFETMMSYAEAERLEQQTGLSDPDS